MELSRNGKAFHKSKEVGAATNREASADGQPAVEEWNDQNEVIDNQADGGNGQKVRFRMSKLTQSKKFSTPVDQISPQESDPASSADPSSPLKIIKDQEEQKSSS